MKIEFFDKETGKIIPDYIERKDWNIQYAVFSDGYVFSIHTAISSCVEDISFNKEEKIGWRVVEEVKEPRLVVDWSKVPPEYKWAAMNETGKAYAYSEEPTRLDLFLGCDPQNAWGCFPWVKYINVNDLVLSKPSPDKWRESLIQRPEGV